MKIFKGFFCLLLFNCQSNNSIPIPNYSMSNPEYVYVLSEDLREISGLTYVEEQTVASIQDEEGIIYFYDLKSQSVDSTISFGPPGDYEAIEKAGNDFYIMKSDGTLIKFSNGKSKTIDTFLDENANTEGLCYDEINNSLLIACKGKSPRLDKHERGIYSFDLSKGQLEEKPTYTIDKNDINNQTFSPSAIAIHPIDKTIYVVSSKGALLVLNRKGEIINYENLSRKLFRQPEGICFNKEGDMYIADEGEGNGRGTILKFNYEKR